MRPAKRLLALALTVGAGAGAIAAIAVAPATAGSTATTPTINLMNTTKGKLLSTQGFVLYRFSHDGSGSKNTCVKISGCLTLRMQALAKITLLTGPPTLS